MRRSSSFQPAPPRSGDSFSSTSSSNRPRKRRTRRHQPKRVHGWSFLIKILLLIAAFLSVVDVALWWRKHHSLGLEHDYHSQNQRKPPHSVKGDGDDATLSQEDSDQDREEIYNILRQARIDPAKLSNEQKRRLPTWSTVTRLYGDVPKIHGLDTCEKFRNITEPSLTFLAMAGTFNSGTNLLASLMIRNCQITERMKVYGEKQKGMRWQVKWGKHTPPKYREQHVTRTDKDVPLEYTLPLITIRDPYNWMQSMCRHEYEAHWTHDANHCPHVWNEETSHTSRVQVNYAEATSHHLSLPGMWNDWYNEYLGVDFPRIIVRMEDLIFHGKQVTETLCKCGGGSPRQPQFQHISQSAKLGTAQHGSDKTSLVEAMIRYGTDEHRLNGMTSKDLEVTRDILDERLMKLFDYKYA